MKKIWQKSLASMVSAALCLTAFVGCLTVNAATTTHQGTITSKGVKVEATATEATVELDVSAVLPEGAKGMACAGLKVTTGYGTLTNAVVTSEGAYVATTSTDGEEATGTPDIGADGQFIVWASDTEAGVSSFTVSLTFNKAESVTAGTYPVNVEYLGSKDIGAANWDEDAFTFTTDVAGIIVHAHNVVYTSNSDGTHTSACDALDCPGFTPATEPCVDENSDNVCDKCSENMGSSLPSYSNVTFYVSQAVRVIEPWAIRFTIRHADTDNGKTNINLSDLTDYGIYILSDVHVPEGTQVDMDYIVQNGRKITSVDATSSDGLYYNIVFSDELYTYLMGKTLYYVPYCVSNGAEILNRLRTTSLVNVLNTRRSAIVSDPASVKELNVIDTMLSLYDNVYAYRGNDNYSETVKNEIPRVADTTFSDLTENTTYTFLTSRSVRVIEPWAISFTIRIADKSNTANTYDLNTFDDYGMILLKESSVVSTPDVNALLSNGQGYVFSKSKGNISVSDNRFTAIFDDEIFTYQMNENYYYLPFCVKDGKMYVRPAGVANTTIQSTLNTRLSAINSSTIEKEIMEKAVINNMIALYNYVTIYRS